MTSEELMAKIKAEIERISSKAMNEEGKDICEYLLSFLSTLEEKSEKPIIPNDRDEAAKDILTAILSNPIQMTVGDKPIKTVNDYLNISIELTNELIKRLKEK